MLTEGEKEFVEAFSEWVSADGVECGFTGGGFRLRCPLSGPERAVTWTWKSAEDFCRGELGWAPDNNMMISIFGLARMYKGIRAVQSPFADIEFSDAGKALPEIPAFEALKAKLILLAGCTSPEEAVVVMAVAGRGSLQ